MIPTDAILECAKSVLNRILHNLIFLVIVYCIWTPIFHFSSALCWHVIFCTLGILPFMCEGLILLGYDLLYGFEVEEKSKVWLHIIFTSLGSVFLVAGVGLAIGHIEGEEVAHFSSTHGSLGLTFIVFWAIALILGLLARFSKALRGYAKPVIFELLHNVSGILCFILAIASICTGYYLDSFQSPEESKIGISVTIGSVCVWCLLHPFYKMYREIRTLLN